jgi:hypothetical protein
VQFLHAKGGALELNAPPPAMDEPTR